jgi:voltage-gated potassium channel
MFKRDNQGKVNLGKWEFLIQALIILSLVAFSVETLPSVTPEVMVWLHFFEVSTVIVFTIEFFVRLLWSRPRGTYAFTFMGIIDLISILPFYLALGIDLRSIRALRLLRLFRLFKLARFSSAMDRYVEAFREIKEALTLFGVTALITIYISSVGIYYFEHEAQPEAFASVFDAMWWSVVTLTTVGYGDVYPVTAGGKIFTIFVVLVGLGVVAVPTGLFASALSKLKD